MRVLHLLWLFILLPQLALAAPIKPYFDASQLPPTLLAAPLDPRTTAGKEQVDAVLAKQKNLPSEEVEGARSEIKMWADILVAPVLPKLTREAYPKTFNLLDRAGVTAKKANDAFKDYWHIDRPYVVDSHIIPYVDKPTNFAYPSGHTSGSFVWAHILGQLIPEKRDAFYAQAEHIAQHRVMVGLHYPQDLRGGKELAFIVMGGLLQNTKYQREFEAAREELKARPPL
jgi:acid phosphatase (class A)